MLVFVIVVLIILAFVFFALNSKSGATTEYPYQKVKALFTPAERSFLGVMDQVLGSDYRIFGKVRIADVATVKSLPNRSAWQKAFNRISSKHFDFVICKSSDLSIVCAVELNDKSHQKSKRKSRDEFVSGVCKSISLPLVEVEAQASYSVQELKVKFGTVLNLSTSEQKALA